MTIEEFIEARLAEDEAAARPIPHGEWRHVIEHDVSLVVDSDNDTVVYTNDIASDPHIARHDPARVLRQCAALRNILTLAKSAMDAHEADNRNGTGDEGMYGYRMGEAFAYRPVLKAIAATWSDHPDYRQEFAS